MKKWIMAAPRPELAQKLSLELKISPLTAQVLINRGVTTLAEAEVFLRPRLANLRDPMEIPNIAQASQRVLQAKAKEEKVLVFGDYDVDGVTGTATLIHTLRFLGIPATYYIPHRYGEGYSLSLDSVKQIAKQGVKLIITVDCGSSSVAEIELANSLGMEVIVTDHHNLPKQLPRALAIVNPKMIEGDHPSKDLAGAGVAFKFAWALLRQAGIKDSKFLTSLLDLTSLGTVSDVVPLTAENRILALVGLNLIDRGQRVGIKALAEAAALKGKISVNHIYFGLAPRINAAGRLEHASRSVDLLLTDDPVEAKALAAELTKINIRRQEIGRKIKTEVFDQLDDNYIEQNKLVLLSGHNWHPGVIGIVASQVVDRFSRPTILVNLNDGLGRGSARSVDNFNIFSLLDSCRDLFLDFGGHAGAAGFEIKAENLSELEQRLKKEIDARVGFDDLRPHVMVDAELAPQQINLGLVKELGSLDPYGEGNPAPVFVSRELNLFDLRLVGKNDQHLKLKLTDQTVNLETIGFGLGDLAEQLKFDTKYDIAYRLESNEWNGFETAQLRLLDIRPAQAPDGAGPARSPIYNNLERTINS